MALHCTECGFVNAEGANYCQRCGSLLPRAETTGEPVTATYRIDDEGDLVPVELDEVTAHGPALVIRAGGGAPVTIGVLRSGKPMTFVVTPERQSSGAYQVGIQIGAIDARTPVAVGAALKEAVVYPYYTSVGILVVNTPRQRNE